MKSTYISTGFEQGVNNVFVAEMGGMHEHGHLAGVEKVQVRAPVHNVHGKVRVAPLDGNG
jgi:hypothetical protein